LQGSQEARERPEVREAMREAIKRVFVFTPSGMGAIGIRGLIMLTVSWNEAQNWGRRKKSG
jgi:hypothetical protein